RYLRRQYRYRRYWPPPPAVRAEADFLGHWAFPRPPAGGLFLCLSAKVSLAKKAHFSLPGMRFRFKTLHSHRSWLRRVGPSPGPEFGGSYYRRRQPPCLLRTGSHAPRALAIAHGNAVVPEAGSG